MARWKESDRLVSYNATGADRYAATRENYLRGGFPSKGVLSVSVPGLLESWMATKEEYGVQSLGQVVAQ